MYEKEKTTRETLESEVRKRIDFTRVLMHELKNPLTAILTSTDILKDSQLPAPYDRVVNSITRSASELNDRVGELLELTRAEVGELRIKPRRVNPEVMLKEIMRDNTSVISAGNIKFFMELPAGLPYVKADRNRIRQVVDNILDNAIKATPSGGEIRLSAVTDIDFLVIQVKDTGKGMGAKDRAHVFEPYYRVSVISRYEGLGLGLAISKQIVELHGGKIWVESKPGKGSTFSFSIPLS